jgi:eukaryotic-like serine/threonine-protein kinase
MAHDDDPLTEPEQIGPYKVLDVLGEGGMGVVYLAEQSVPVRRRVALKILKPGMDSKQVLARFESERQALAVMDHPNIARAIDGGMTEAGRPYFVMELVHGTPITAYADTHRLTTTERLRLFIDVCRAVQHAHQKGVIHRDLKPSNVLITVQEGDPVVKVIDFGIAKAVGLGLTERTLVTRTGQILGTPEYMSPEQAEMSGLDVDTRTDVYSLGVMLYELIVGALPFDLASKPDYAIPHTLRERDVPRPSTRLTGLGHTLPVVARHRRTTPESLRKELRGDLDWIILKAMDKDRTRRYETANGLALDVQRHIDNEPVLARPPSTRDRVGKFVRRNRTGVIAATVAIVALLTGGAGATIGFVQARHEQRRAQEAAATAEQVTEFLTGLFRVSNPGEARGNTITAREVLDRGAEQIRSDLSDQPLVEARLMRVMGDVYRNLGLYDAAAPLLERAVTRGASAGVDDEELATALQRLAIVYRHQGRLAEAEATLRRSFEMSQSGGTDRGVQFASALRSLSNVYQLRGLYGEAESLLREALDIQERLLGPDDPELGITLSNLGGMYLRQRSPSRAEPYLREALRITERTHGSEHIHVAEELSNLGAMHYMLERYAESDSAYRRALAIAERVLDPSHPLLGGILHNLAEVQWVRGEYAEAEAGLERALAIGEETLGRDHVAVAASLRVLANVHRDQGRYHEAEPRYARALAIYDRAMDRPDAAVRELLQDYARLLHVMARSGEAEALERRAASVQ